MLTNQPIYIEPGETFVLTRSVLHIEDYDNPQDVLLMVLEPPQHGRLTRVHGDGQVSRFKLEELVREQLQYIHDGSSGEQDRLLLQINDGHSYHNVLVHVNIAQRVSNGYQSVGLWSMELLDFVGKFFIKYSGLLVVFLTAEFAKILFQPQKNHMDKTLLKLYFKIIILKLY